MSTQNPNFLPVPFSASFPQQRFRLLELPPELVGVIEGQSSQLYFKSSPALSPGVNVHTNGGGMDLGSGMGMGMRNGGSSRNTGPDTDSAREGYLHLCTDDKVWTVKQVSTSNSVYVTQTTQLRPTPRRKEPDGDGDTNMHSEEQDHEADLLPHGQDMGVDTDVATGQEGRGITTIAQVKNILELIEVKPDEGAVETRIRAMVPLYRDADADVDGSELESPTGKLAVIPLRDVLENIPAPKKVILALLRRLFAVGLDAGGVRQDNQALYIPSTSLLLRAWREFMRQCAIMSVKVDAQKGVESQRLGDVLRGLREAESGEEGELLDQVVRAILTRFSETEMDTTAPGTAGEQRDIDTGLDLDLYSNLTKSTTAKLTFNAEELRDVIGRWLLDCLVLQLQHKQKTLASNTTPSIPVAEFVAQWTDLLPDSWAQVPASDVRRLLSSFESVETTTDEVGKELLRVTRGPGITVPGDAVIGPSGSTIPKSAAGGPTADEAKNPKKRKWHEKFGKQRDAAALPGGGVKR